MAWFGMSLCHFVPVPNQHSREGGRVEKRERGRGRERDKCRERDGETSRAWLNMAVRARERDKGKERDGEAS